MTRVVRALAALVLYTATIVLANVLTARYGLVPVLPGLLVTAGTYSAGLALLARDVVQDVAGRTASVGAILGGSLVSWWLTDSPELALASGVAFAVGELADFAVYTPLRSRSWARAVLASNTVGAVLDSIVFLALAPFPLTLAAVTGQTIGKALWATAVPVLVVLAVREVRRRALPVRGAGPRSA